SPAIVDTTAPAVLSGLERKSQSAGQARRLSDIRCIRAVFGSTERPRSRTEPAVGYTTSPVLKISRARSDVAEAAFPSHRYPCEMFQDHLGSVQEAVQTPDHRGQVALQLAGGKRLVFLPRGQRHPSSRLRTRFMLVEAVCLLEVVDRPGSE